MGDEAVARLLVERNIDIETRNENEQTPPLLAAKNKYSAVT
jgi:hypothetical protein